MLSAAGVAQGATITFDALANPGEWQYTSDTYVDQGYSFAATLRTNGYSLYSYGATDPLNADPAGATLSENYDDEAVVVSRVQGGSFTLASFDVAYNPDEGNSGRVRFDYTDAQGTHSTNLSFTDQYVLHTFVFDYAGLTSFALWGDDFQLDNVVVQAQANVVPEPATWWLLTAGLAFLLARRKAS